MAIKIHHLEAALADLRKEKLSLNGAIALGVLSVFIKQQKENTNGNNQ